MAGLHWNQWLSIAVLAGVATLLLVDRLRAASTAEVPMQDDDGAVVGRRGTRSRRMLGVSEEVQ
ncbi:MAG: hypothetical protein RIB65_14205 [Ilumatobacter fluminis]|uniref:hypothetical protein n=1 Tax=Ilumatobacter fluminis TaxID=467091 RepID=UPI0032EF487E